MPVLQLLYKTPVSFTLLALLLSLLAAVFWWYFFKQRSSQLTTKNSSILQLFIVGLVMVIPLALVESSVVSLLPSNFQDILFINTGELTPVRAGVIALVMFFVAALLEEVSKFYFLKKIMPHHEIDQVIDSIKFGVAIGIGFAIVENALFLLAPFAAHDYISVATTFFLRFFFSTLAHAVYSGIAGYYLGRAKFEPWKRKQNIALALFLPIMAHGLFNTLLLVGLGFYALPLILILFFWLLHWYQNKKTEKKFGGDAFRIDHSGKIS